MASWLRDDSAASANALRFRRQHLWLWPGSVVGFRIVHIEPLRIDIISCT
jgi:hypothetical protein